MSEDVSAFECPTNWGERFGQRVRGFLHPPETGEYVFWIASDDASELRLSVSEAPAEAKRIAWVEHWTGPREWERSPTQMSQPVRLEAVRRYYVEAVHKEGGGGDNLAVAWRAPGGEREVIPGEHLSPWSEADDADRGSITREVWKGIGGSTLDELTSSPRYPGGAKARLAGDGSAVATFGAERSGRYVFELTVSDAAATADDRVSVLVTDRLENGTFEEGKAGRPSHWESDGNAERVGLVWEEAGGRGGSRCVSIATRDASLPANAKWRQPLRLAPHTPYRLEGYVRGEGMRASEGHPAVIGVSMWRAENGPAADVASLGWTEFRTDFATGHSGDVDVICKLGSLQSESAGKVCFDDLSLVRNPDVETFEGEHFILHLYKDQIEIAGRANIEKIIAHTDAVCGAYTNLTGFTPPAAKQAAWAPDGYGIGALGWSGSPTLWSGNRRLLREHWRRVDEGFMPEVFLHELAHNWDHWSFTFHIHFNEFKMYYALETLDLAIAEDGWNRGKATRHRWEFRSRKDRESGIMNEVGQVYRNIEIRDKIGWEPFKKVFRYFLALAPEDVPTTPWGKFKLWHDKLTEISGFDAWSVYTPEEIEFVRYYYGPKPETKTLARVGPDVREVWLADVRWGSASVGWEKPESGFFPSGKRLHLKSIYGHAASSYSYRLGRGWKGFTTTYGLRRACPGSVVFVVKGDGKELLRSDLVKDSEEREISLDVSGVEELELVVEDGGDGKSSDHGIWFSPKLVR